MEANERRQRTFTPPHDPPQPPQPRVISARHITPPGTAGANLAETNIAETKDETLSLLRTVKFDHQLRKDEVLGLVEKRVIKKASTIGFRPGSGAESNFSSTSYANWRDDPFYDIDAYSTDEETQDKKTEDEKDTDDDDSSTVVSAQPSIEVEGEVKEEEKPQPPQPTRINYPRSQPKIKQTASLAVLQFSRKTLLEASAPLPNPNTSSFTSKPLGATTWSPRHTALTQQTRALPAFSSLVRTSPMENSVATKFDGVISNTLHQIATPVIFNLDAAAPLTSPLRQKVYTFDINSPHVHENARHIFKNPADNSMLSIIDTPIKNLRGVFKVTILTPVMSQHAKLPVSGHMMGRGGINFLAYSSAGRNNVKRHFYTFKFDEEFTTDQEEIEKGEAVEMVKEAFLSHGTKTFRGSVVVNLDATAVGMLEKKLKINFSTLNPVQKQEFMKQHRVSIVGLLGAENGGKPLFERAEEDDDDDMSRISDLTGPGFNQALADFQKNLQNPTNDSTPSSSVIHVPSAPSPAVNLNHSTTTSLDTPQNETLTETTPTLTEDPTSAADDLANMRKSFVNATPPTPPEDFSASPFYEGVVLSWMAPPEDPMVPLTGYLIQYTKHLQKKSKRGSLLSAPQPNPTDDTTTITSLDSVSSPTEDTHDQVHEVKLLRSKTDPTEALPTSYRLENLKGGYDYFFRLTCFNAVGASQTVNSKKVSPSAIITAKSKDDLPVIFQRFGIEFSKVENVKQSLDELWARYEKSEFYLEVNQKKELVMHIIRLDIFVQRSLSNSAADVEVVVETYSQTNDERLREINEVPHKILRKNEPWQRAIRKIAADLFVVDEEDMKLLSFDQKMEKPTNSDVFPGLKVTQHNLRAFVNVQGLPPTSKFHTVQTSNASGITSTVHHYFEWMDIRKYFVQRKEVLKLQRKTIYQSGGGMEVASDSNIQVDPFGRPLTDEQGYPLAHYDPRRILVEQLVQKLYEGCDSLFYSVLASTNSINCLLQIQLFDKSGIAQDATLCKIGTSKSIAMECTTFDKLDAFCPENVPQRDDSKPMMLDSMGGIKLKLSMADWVESKLKGESHIDLVSTLGEVLNWESDKRVQQFEAQLEKNKQSDESEASDDSDSDSGNNANDDGEDIWEKNFELDDYFSMDHLNKELGSRPFGDAMKVIAEVFGEILAQLSMTTAAEDPLCDLIEDYQIKHLLRIAIITNEGSKLEIKPTERKFIELFHNKIKTAQQMPSHVEYYHESPVVGPTPENFHGDSILLDSNAKLWFAGDTGKFIERGHVLSAICKFEVLLIIEHLKLPVTINDINSAAGADQIADWLTISHDVALSIITCRNKLGKFTSKQDLFDKVAAVSTAAVKQKVNALLVTEKDSKIAIASAAKFTNGLLCWHDLRKTARFADSYPPRMEFLWELICLLRRKLLLYGKGKHSYNSLHHKTGLLSFFLRSSMSTKKSASQRQCAYNAALQICRVIYPSFTILPRVGGRVKSLFWETSTFSQRALTEEEFQLELIHYKIDCASKFSNVVDSFRHQTMEVMRHNVSVKTLSDDDKEKMMLLHSEIGSRKVKDQLYSTSKTKHWEVSDETSDEGVNVLLRHLFAQTNNDPNQLKSSILGNSAAKLFIIGSPKSGKTTLCGKLVVRILASKQIKRDFGVVPLLIPVHKLVMHYAKEIEESDDQEEEEEGEGESGGDEKNTEKKGAWEEETGGRGKDESTSGTEEKEEFKRVDLLDAYFHQECSRFSRRYQALKKLQSEFKLVFIFDGIDEAGPLREHVEGYINDKLKSRNQMVIVTSKQPPLPSMLPLYKWFGTMPLSPTQQLEYAKRKLDHDDLGNTRENVFQTAATVLLDPNFSRLSTNPLMLSMIVSLMSGATNTHNAVTHHPGNSSTGQNGRQKTFLKGLSLDGLKGAAESQPANSLLLNSLPFKDKPSMFAHATKMTIIHLDINSGLSDTKIENKTIFKFFQKLAWYCHTHTIVDITNSTMVDLLQQTGNEFKNEGRGTEEEAHHLANTYRHIWNHVTMLVKGHAKKFELMSTTSFQTKISGGLSQTESLFQFSHISFQEYFTAMELLDRLQSTVSSTVNGIEACKQVFTAAGSSNSGQILHNFWWLNVIYFAASAAPSWLYVDMCKFLLQNDDDSASNATLCYELSRLRGENVAVGRPRSVQRLVNCLSSTCVYLRRWALAEIQVNASYKVDIISSLTKALSDDLERSTSTLPWYSKASICNSLVCMDAALYCVGSNRTLHLKIVQVLSKILSDDGENETVKSLVIDSIRSMGLQHEPLVRSMMAKMLGKKQRSEIKTLVKMISRMGITDSHVLCVIAGFLNDPDLRLCCEDALVEIVMGQIWQASANPLGGGMGMGGGDGLEPLSQAARYMSNKKNAAGGKGGGFGGASGGGKRNTSFGGLATAAAAANKFRSSQRKRMNVIITNNYLPDPTIHMLLQIMALPNSDHARASAARVLGRCNIHDRLIPLFVTWMKNAKGTIPSRTAADLEFPSLTMVNLLSVNFPIEKLLSDSTDKFKKISLQVQCMEMLDCLIHGGQNIGQMLSDENMAETGGILPKMLRCLNATAFPNLQLKAISALQACNLTGWPQVRESMMKRLNVDLKSEVRGACLAALLKEVEVDKMEVLYSVVAWLKEGEKGMRLDGAKECAKLKLFSKENIMLLEDPLKGALGDLIEIRVEALRGMLSGGLSGNYLSNDLPSLSRVLLDMVSHDSELAVRSLAAKVMLEGTGTEDKAFQDIIDLLGGWIDGNRTDLFLTCVEIALFLPAEYWNSVNYTASSKFSFVQTHSNITVQSILKLTDSSVSIGDVQGVVMDFVRSVGNGGFSLRLLTAMLDGESFSRLLIALEKGDDDLTVKTLHVIDECFIPEQTPLSTPLRVRIMSLLQLSEDMDIRALCSEITLKFGLDLEPFKRLIDGSKVELHTCALNAILKHPRVLVERGDLQQVLLNFAPRMASENLILVFKILKQSNLELWADEQLNRVRTLIVALMERIKHEFDVLHDDDSGDDDVMGFFDQLSPWCIPCIEVLEKHVFLLSSISQEHLQEENRRMEESINTLSLSEQALLEQRRTGRKKTKVGGAQTVVGAKRLVETLQKVVAHVHSDPEVLEKVCSVFAQSISTGEHLPLPALIYAMVDCDEPERGVIILNALEKIKLTKDGVKPMLKSCLNDSKMRSFLFKPLLKFLSEMRSQEECEWQMPKDWASIIAKGMKEKIVEIAFLMKELRIGGMLSSVGNFVEKKDELGEKMNYNGVTYEPQTLGVLIEKFHVEFRDHAEHQNYHERRKSMVVGKKKKKKILNVDSGAGGLGNIYRTIGGAILAAEDGDEIHVFPKADGSSYEERLVVDKNILIKGMKNTFKVEAAARRDSGGMSPKHSPKSPKRGVKSFGGEGGEDEGEGGDGGELEEDERGLSTLAIVEGMVDSMKHQKEEDEAFEKQKELENIAKVKGKKLEKKSVVIELKDYDDDLPVIRTCASLVRLQNITVKHGGKDTFAAIFASYGLLNCQQVKVFSEGGDGIYVTQGASLRCRTNCHLGPCKRNGVLIEGLCSSAEITDCEIRGNIQCGVKTVSGSSIMMKKNRINSNEGHGVSVGHKCPADLMQNAFEHNGDMHLYVDAPWFPKEKDMINISNVDSDDEFRVTSRLNTIKSTKTWSKGRRYSLHGTQNFMDALGGTADSGGGKSPSPAKREVKGDGGGGVGAAEAAAAIAQGMGLL
ncbi:hypothetical protein TrLO_g8805 [Triparma laevis f. longispina]|uniref:Fibronectin type-III domain-containing protein n=1 Tax=Triparma laevis f. longispina TaxID=1714387 RepID=A0A9W7A514_9STRA|nr:hypothetical protein TrLO_g8805 [Triparma laevis f. longispina]